MFRRRMVAAVVLLGTVSLSTLVPITSGQPTTQPVANDAKFSYAGQVVSADGKAIAGVEVIATYTGIAGRGKWVAYIDDVTSDKDGRFSIDRETALSGATPSGVVGKVISLEFRHPDYAFAHLEDLNLLGRDQQTHLRLTLRHGRSLQGKVVDARRSPVARASVEITFGDVYDARRGVVTDSAGHFILRGLPDEAGDLNVLTTNPREAALTAHVGISADVTDAGTVTAIEVELPEGTVTHDLLGMKLVDVTPFLQQAFHLSRPDGVLVLDPGKKVLGLDLQRGDQFWIVGDTDTAIKNVADFASQMLAESEKAGQRVRVVYCFARPDFSGTNTQYVTLTADDRARLSAVR